MKLHLPSIQKKTANMKSCFIFPNGEVEVKAIAKKYTVVDKDIQLIDSTGNVVFVRQLN